MQTQPQIRNGDAEDIELLAATLSASFAADPMLNWVFPSADLYPDFFRLVIRDVYLPRGFIHMEAQGRAAALWLPPEERFEIPPRMALLNLGLRLLLQSGPRPLMRIRRQGSVFARHLPREPHFYLQFLGCHPQHQGLGIGATLLKRGTHVCDEQGMGAWLECSNALNVPLYERHGFEVKHTQNIASDGPQVWFMWREAH